MTLSLDCPAFQKEFNAWSAAHTSDAHLVDVRTQEEFDAGHLPGCIHIPVAELTSRYAELPRDGALFLYCRSGGRALSAADFLTAQGFERVYCAIHGGYTQLAEEH